MAFFESFDLNSVLKAGDTARNRRNAAIEQIKFERNSAEQSFKERNDDMNTKKGDLNTKMNDLVAEKDTLEERRKEAHHELTAASFAGDTTRVNSLGDTIKDLEESIAELESKIKEVEEEVAEVEKKIEELEKEEEDYNRQSGDILIQLEGYDED